MKESLLAKLAPLAAAPIIALNVLGGIVSGIWLLFLGQWQLLLWGIGIMIVGSFILALFLMIPMLIFGLPAAKLYEKGKTGLGSFLGLCNLAATLIVISSWCITIFQFYLGAATEATIIPLVIWSYGIATGELSYMASKEKENEGTMATLFGAQLAYVAMLLIFLFSRNEPFAIWAFSLVMIFTFFAQAAFVKSAITKQKENEQREHESRIETYLTNTIVCPNCGKEDVHGGKFCVNCGTNLQVE